MTGNTIRNFVIGEIIGQDGRNTVYRGVQKLGCDLERPVAIKILHGWEGKDPQEVEQLRSEMRTLLELGNSSHIVKVYDFDVDERIGPWMAMELASRNLRHEIAETPANPAAVRQLLCQVLQALCVMHDRPTPILHRDVKPRNILRGADGSWVLSDFSLASPGESERTMSRIVIKYAAPEVIDGKIASVSPRSDLYSLGMCIYEFALGTKLFRQQFPAVYGDESPQTPGKNEQAKWLYWQASMSLEAPAVKSLLPEFPQDLSDAIARLMRKDPKERPGRAMEVLESVNSQSEMLATPAWSQPRQERHSGGLTPLTMGLLAFLLVAMIGVGAFAAFKVFAKRPKLLLDAEQVVTTLPTVRITGSIVNMPARGEAVVSVRGGGTAPIALDSQGRFAAEVRVGQLGTTDAMLKITDAAGQEVLSTLLAVERRPPPQVQVTVITQPPVAGARITFTTCGDKPVMVTRQANDQGVADCNVAYGSFDLTVEHARFVVYRRTLRTDADPIREFTASLIPISKEGLEDARKKLASEYESLKAKAAAGDPEAIRRMAEIQKELAQLGDSAASPEDAAKRKSLASELEQLAAKTGDPTVLKRIKEIQQELAALDEKAQAAREKKIKGDGDTAVATTSQPTRTTTAPSVDSVLDERRNALLREAASLRARAAAGDPEAIRRLAEIDREMAVLDASKCPKAMGDLEKRMAALAARAAAGDPAAAAELRELEKAKNVLAQLAAGKIDVNEALRVLGGQSSVSDLDRQAIAQMSLPALREYLLNSIPRRAMRLQDVTQTNRIRVSGCVVNESELLRVLTRLAPAAERVVCELRIDPNPIVERLTAQLTEAGVRGARVHPFLQEPQHKLLVQMERSSPSKADAARLIALEFIVESDLLELQEVDGPGPTAAPKDADGAGSKVPAPSTLKTGD